MLSEELSYEYYYCYVLLSVDNISVVVFLTRRGGGLVKFLVILGYQSVRLVHECFVAHGLYCFRELNFDLFNS